MGAVGSAAAAARLVDLDMGDIEFLGLEALSLGVRLGVLEEAEDELTTLLGPAADGRRHILTLRVALDAQLEADEGDDLLLLNDVVQVLLGARESHMLDGGACLARIFEADAEVASARLHGCGVKSK